MYLIKRVFPVILLFSGIISAQIEYDITDYVVDMPIVQLSPKALADQFGIDKSSIMNLTRLRLKPEIYFSDYSRVNIEYEIASLYLSSASPLPITGGGKTNRQIVELSWSPVSENNFLLNHYIDRLYFRTDFDWGNISVGRQRISWGTGRIWNPTDLFNPINPANFSKMEKDGADAVSLMYNIANFTDLNLVFNPTEEFNESSYGFRFRSNYSEYDFSIVGGKFDDRIVAGGDFAGNLFAAGFRGEGIYSQDKDNPDDNFVKWIAGIDFQFSAEIYAVLEYHFNGQGTRQKSKYLNNFAKLGSGEILNLNRSYLYAGGNYQFNPLLGFNFGSSFNLVDGSGFFLGGGNYSYSENIYLSCGAMLSFGSDYSEYWYYSNSIYGQIEYYF